MTPAQTASAAECRRGRVAGAGLALLLIAALGGAPARAADQPDPYSATVKVDATADSAAAARTLARVDGQRHALEDVVKGLSGSTDEPKLPKLDDQAITGLVASFEVAHEKMSTVRYLADYTFHFRAAKIRQLMRSAGISPVAPPAKPVVIVPLYRDGDKLVLWDDPNPWREAWGEVAMPSSPTRLSLPLGGVGDLTSIDAEQARSGDAQALGDLAQRNDGDEALVAFAKARRQGDRLAGLDVDLKRYRAGQTTAGRSDSIDINPGENDGDFFKRAVGVVVGDIEHGGAPVAPKEASVSATIPITTLADWVTMRQRLATVPGIRKVDLLSLSRQQAKITIRYVGDPDQLRTSLAQADLGLDGSDPDYRLVPASAAGPH